MTPPLGSIPKKKECYQRAANPQYFQNTSPDRNKMVTYIAVNINDTLIRNGAFLKFLAVEKNLVGISKFLKLGDVDRPPTRTMSWVWDLSSIM